MAQVAPKQIQSDSARRGQGMEWNGQTWTPGENLADIVSFLMAQDAALRAMVRVLAANNFPIPDEAQMYL